MASGSGVVERIIKSSEVDHRNEHSLKNLMFVSDCSDDEMEGVAK